MTVSSPQPPHGLQLVVDFVNTLDVEAGEDGISARAALAGWLSARQLLTGSARVREIERALQLREALRAVMLAHNGGSVDAAAAGVLESAARRGALSVGFNVDGSTRVQALSDGLSGALARLLIPVTLADADGSWQRVKACRAEDCHWSFYDHSRNRSGRWCDMAVCGNRTKVRAYRTKRG